MRPRSLLLVATATAALTALPLTAQAATTELIDRAAYASTVERSEGTLRVAGATRGELGGHLDVTVTAHDGTLPTGSQVCEPATVDAVLTVAPGEVLRTTSTGEACTGFAGDSLTVNAAFGKQDLTYEGSTHRRAKVVGDGLVAVSLVPWFGGQASFSAALKW